MRAATAYERVRQQWQDAEQKLTDATVKLTRLERRAELAESRVKALDWQRITPENLPKVGDELYSDMSQLVMRFHKDYTSMFTFTPWTHFRPISAPVEEKENKHV